MWHIAVHWVTPYDMGCGMVATNMLVSGVHPRLFLLSGMTVSIAENQWRLATSTNMLQEQDAADKAC